jgi:hypothetical protein
MSRHALHFIEKLSLVLVATATLISLFVANLDFTLGLAVGGVLATVNFYALRRLMLGIIESKQSPRQAFLMVLLLLKFGLLGLVLYLVLRFLPIDATGMLLGVSLVVTSIFVEGFRTMTRRNADGDAD